MQITLDIDEARLVLQSLKNSEQQMMRDSRHRDDIQRVGSMIIRLEAEIKVEDKFSGQRW